MSVEKHTRKMYDEYGEEYQRTRDAGDKSRLYNEFLEVPAMVKAVGDVKGKKLLDVGSGVGVHIKKYLKKGAKCYGVDISKTMIELVRKTTIWFAGNKPEGLLNPTNYLESVV